jgi:hypothetical protein
MLNHLQLGDLAVFLGEQYVYVLYLRLAALLPVDLRVRLFVH